MRSVCGVDHHVPLGLHALRVAAQACRRDGVVHDLPLERVERLERDLRSLGADTSDRVLRQCGELTTTLGTEPGDVEHEAAPLARTSLDGQAGELLESIEDLAVGADEGSEVSRVVGDDLDGGTIVLDVDVDVTVEV